MTGSDQAARRPDARFCWTAASEGPARILGRSIARRQASRGEPRPFPRGLACFGPLTSAHVLLISGEAFEPSVDTPDLIGHLPAPATRRALCTASRLLLKSRSTDAGMRCRLAGEAEALRNAEAATRAQMFSFGGTDLTAPLKKSPSCQAATSDPLAVERRNQDVSASV
jgi:hypothetical protein